MHNRMTLTPRVVLLVLVAATSPVGCGGSSPSEPNHPHDGRSGETAPARPPRLALRKGLHPRDRAAWSVKSTQLAGFDPEGGYGVAAGSGGFVVGWNTASGGRLLLAGRTRPRVLTGKIAAGPVRYGASGFALVIEREPAHTVKQYDPYVLLSVLTGDLDGSAMRDISLASGVLKTRSLSVSRAGDVAVSWLACNHPSKGCYPDYPTPDAALHLAELSARGRVQPAITLTGHVGDANDVLAYSPRGDLLAVYATTDHIFARVSAPNGGLSAPALVSPYPGRAVIGAGIDARGAILTAWAEQPCGAQCARVHVRSARRPADSPRFGRVQTLDAGHTDAHTSDDTAGGYLQAGLSDDGRAAVTWNSPTGLHLATGESNAPFNAAGRLSYDPYSDATLAVAADGSAAVVWGPRRGGRMHALVRTRNQTRFNQELMPRPVTDIDTPQASFDPTSGRLSVNAVSGHRLVTIRRRP
jgi:hypothetical protein